jgi:hypothetical protein
MGGVNAATEVGKHELKVCLGSEGELFSEPNQPRAINRIIKRLSPAGCTRVLIEGGSYQSVLIAALRAAELPVAIVNPAGCASSPRASGSWSLSLRSENLRNWGVASSYSVRDFPPKKHSAAGRSPRAIGRLTRSPVQSFAGRGPYPERMLDVSTISRSEP